MQSCVGHQVFLRGQNFAQPFDFGVHSVEQLLDRVHTQFAAFVAVQREANGHVLGQLEEHGLVRLVVGGLRGKSGQRLLQRVLRAHGERAQARLKCRHFHARFRVFARLAQLGEESEHRAHIFFGYGVGAASSAACFPTTDAARSRTAQQCRSCQPLARIAAGRGSARTAGAATSDTTSSTTCSGAASTAGATSETSATAANSRRSSAASGPASASGGLLWRTPQITGINRGATASRAASAATPAPRSTRASATAGNSRATASKSEAWSRAAASAAARVAAALRGENHLQHFVGVFKKVAELVAVCAKRFRGELRSNFDSRDGRIFRHITNLVHLDAGFTGERGF